MILKEENGKTLEPYEDVTIDVPEEFIGVITEQLSLRKGRMVSLSNHQTGWVRLEFKVPARGLLGFRSQMLTDTKGTAILHQLFAGYEPWAGEIKHRLSGVLVADRAGHDDRRTRSTSCRNAASCSSDRRPRSTRG